MNLLPGRDSNPDWNDADIRTVNAISANGCLIPFPNFRKCFDAVSYYRRYLTDYVHLLNDDWEYSHYDRVYDLPEKIVMSHNDAQKISLPFIFDSKSTGNDRIPPPYADVHQSVTLLSRRCSLPHYWSTLRKKITFAGMSCAFHIFVNGRLVGYSDIRHVPISFDITSAWHEGENEVILVLYSSSASDHLRSGWDKQFRGIVSDIYIEAFPAISLTDLDYSSEPLNSEHTSWSVNVTAELSSSRISLESPVVRLDLYDDYKLLSSNEFTADLEPLTDNSRLYDAVKTMSKIDCSFTIENVLAWSADQPSIYDLYITISDSRGYEQVCYHVPVGFRKLERRGKIFLLNGKPLSLITANISINSGLVSDINIGKSRQDNFAGKYTTAVEKLSSKLIEIKNSGCNCLFLADGMADPAILDLADMLGLFVIASTDIFPHDKSVIELINRWPANNDIDFWTNIMSASAADLIKAAKTHCSVIAWNVGRNLTNWPQLDNLLKVCTEADRSRVLLIPSCEHADNGHPSVYHTASGLKAVIADRHDHISSYEELNIPLFYASAAIDQLASADSDILYLLKTLRLPLFGLFLLDHTGSIYSVPSSLLDTASLFSLHASIDAENCSLAIENLHPFANFSNINVDWQSHDEQTWLMGNTIEIDMIQAGKTTRLPLTNVSDDVQEPTHLNFKISWTDNSWPHQGQRKTVCFTLPWSVSDSKLVEPPAGRYTPLSHGRIRLEQDKHILLISGNRFWFIFNKITGNFESWRCGETELFCQVENSTGAGPYWQVIVSNKLQSEAFICTSHVENISFDCDGTGAVIEAEYILTAESSQRFKGTIRYEISHKGELRIAAGIEYDKSNVFMQAYDWISLELVFDLSRHLNQLQWYGYGPTAVENAAAEANLPLPVAPHANNWLRIHSEPISSTVQSWNDTHWLYAGNEQGLGLLIKSDSRFSFAASMLSADMSNGDNQQFFSRHYGQLRLEFAKLIQREITDEDHRADSSSNSIPGKQKGQSIDIIKRQYILQPSALNFI